MMRVITVWKTFIENSVILIPVSGFPGLAFFHFLVAGLLSPYKWLAVTALLDISVTYLPIYLIKEHFSRNKENKGNE